MSTQDAATGGRGGGIPDRAGEPSAFDTTIAHPARVYDYLLGGKDNFAADRAAGDTIVRAFPDVVRIARLQRHFLAGAVRYLASRAGIRQFLDIGTGLPVDENTHGFAQRIAPQSRTVYVDNDAVVLVHARALLDQHQRGATRYIDADGREHRMIVREAAHVLDFSQPIAVMALLILQYIPDS